MIFSNVGVLVAVLALTAGCAMSKVDSDATVKLSGTLEHADGSPAADVEVGLMRVPDPAEFLAQGLVIAGTFGAACLGDDPPPVCKIIQVTRTAVRAKIIEAGSSR